MYETNDSFGTQVDAMFSTWKFTTCSGAFALFYWGPGAKTGLRLEVGFLAKEFVDDVHWGTDPEGLIFYKTPEDFNITGDVQYKVTKNKDTTPSIRVDFFKSGVDIDGKDSVPFSSFITKDTTELSKDLLANYVKSGKGQWKDQQTGTSYGNLTKSADNTTATLKLAPIGKQITWTINESKSCNVTGTFTFYKSDDLTTSTSATADWNPDRVLFHNGNSFYGAFYPSTKIPFKDSKPSSEPSISVSSI